MAKESTTIESLLRRDRLMISVGLALISAVAWAYLFDLAKKMPAPMGAALPDMTVWNASRLLLTLIMWTVMMVAMMTPSVAPMVLEFVSLYRTRHNQDSGIGATAIFLSGYFLVWTLFSALSTLAEWQLHSAALLSPMMAMTNRMLGGVLLVVAGVFQWTELKHRSLRSCRSPIGFFLNEWREGRAGILAMGIKHGAYCLGCCAFLMAILFVAGVMNLFWVSAIAALVLVEKLFTTGPLISRLAGGAMFGWGAWMIVSGLSTVGR
jgi:predicted metal-binding membrane protein